MDNGTRIAVELSVAGVTFASVMDALPAIAAMVGAVYYGVMIWETETIKKWTGRWNKN